MAVDEGLGGEEGHEVGGEWSARVVTEVEGEGAAGGGAQDPERERRADILQGAHAEQGGRLHPRPHRQRGPHLPQGPRSGRPIPGRNAPFPPASSSHAILSRPEFCTEDMHYSSNSANVQLKLCLVSFSLLSTKQDFTSFVIRNFLFSRCCKLCLDPSVIVYLNVMFRECRFSRGSHPFRRNRHRPRRSTRLPLCFNLLCLRSLDLMLCLWA
jgi:hypothetical protein